MYATYPTHCISYKSFSAGLFQSLLRLVSKYQLSLRAGLPILCLPLNTFAPEPCFVNFVIAVYRSAVIFVPANSMSLHKIHPIICQKMFYFKVLKFFFRLHSWFHCYLDKLFWFMVSKQLIDRFTICIFDKSCVCELFCFQFSYIHLINIKSSIPIFTKLGLN